MIVNEKQYQISFDKLKIEHIPEVAQLHTMGIKEGFFGSLGNKVVCRLYRAIIESDQAFGFVAIKDGKVSGFIICVESIRGTYKHANKKDLCKLAWAMLPKMFRWYNIKSIIAALICPSKTRKNLPPAEILTIVVDKHIRRMGVGRRLIEQSYDEFRNRGIKWIKVITAEDQQADEFYKTVGFKLIEHSQKRGVLLNIYAMKISND
jgi:ribosomal protein S18 acetylase RimI-like enzyme